MSPNKQKKPRLFPPTGPPVFIVTHILRSSPKKKAGNKYVVVVDDRYLNITKGFRLQERQPRGLQFSSRNIGWTTSECCLQYWRTMGSSSLPIACRALQKDGRYRVSHYRVPPSYKQTGQPFSQDQRAMTQSSRARISERLGHAPDILMYAYSVQVHRAQSWSIVPSWLLHHCSDLNAKDVYCH